MKIVSPILLGMALAMAGGAFAAAQDSATAPPKVIEIVREYLKPGADFMAYDRAESAFASIANRLKLQGHNVALSSISGKSRTIWISRYPTFASVQNDNDSVWAKNPAAVAEMNRAIMSEGSFVESIEFSFFSLNEDLSYRPRPDLSHARFYEINVFHVRPGHRREWMEAVKMYKDGCDKAANDAHWGMYEIMFGGESNTFIALTHRTSLGEIDTGMAGNAKFVEAMGGIEGMQKFDELYGHAVDSAHAEIYSINPKLSYPDEAWVKGDPDFWKPKPKAPEAAVAKPGTSKAPPAASSKSGTR